MSSCVARGTNDFADHARARDVHTSQYAMTATKVQIAVLIADEDDIDAVIDTAIATMTDAAVFSLLTAPQDVPVTLSIPTSPVIETAIDAAIDAAIEAAIAAASEAEPAPPTKGVFPASYSEEAWQGAATI
jgi:hypothetical protein